MSWKAWEHEGYRNRLFYALLVGAAIVPLLFANAGNIPSTTMALVSGAAVSSAFWLVLLLLSLLPRVWFLGLSVLVFCVLCLLIFGNWWHFQYFQSYFNYAAIGFGDDAFAVSKAISSFAHSNAALKLLVGGLVLLVVAAGFYPRKQNPLATAWAVLPALALLVFFSLKVHVYENRLRDYASLLLLPDYFHPAHAFFVKLTGDSDDIQKMEDAWQDFKSMNRNAMNKPDNSQPVVRSGEKHNVIILVLESFRASFIGHYGAEPGLTPNFDSLAEKSITAKHFYANSNFTVKAETSILCGKFDLTHRPSIAEHDAAMQLKCLPHVLQEEGYETFYFHANHGRFYNRERYMPALGFSNLYFHADAPAEGFVPQTNNIGWGIADEDLYRIVIKTLADQSDQSPFFAHVMSISSHYPFDHEWPVEPDPDLIKGEDEVYRNYQKAIFYSDYALGAFWRLFKTHGLDRNTILIVTSDHGVWSFLDEAGGQSVKADEMFFRAPLLIYSPDIVKPLVVEQIASHIDLMPTILNLLGVEYNRGSLVGKDLLRPVADPWAVMTKNSAAFLRTGDAFCKPLVYNCSGAQQSCFFDDRLGERNGNTMHCGSVVGEDIVGDKKEYRDYSAIAERARMMIGYENYQLFEDPEASGMRVPEHKSRQQVLFEMRQEVRQ